MLRRLRTKCRILAKLIIEIFLLEKEITEKKFRNIERYFIDPIRIDFYTICRFVIVIIFISTYFHTKCLLRNLTSDKARDVKSHFNVEQWERMETAMLCLMNNANDDFALRKKVLDRLKTDDKEIIAIRQNSNLAERHRKLYNSEARELKYGKALIINQEKYDSTCRPHYEIRHGSHEDEIELAKVRFGILFNAFLETFLQ